MSWLVREGWLDAAEMLIIPDDLSARLAVAEGLEGASDEEWQDYRGMFARAARSVNPSQFNDYQGTLNFSAIHSKLNPIVGLCSTLLYCSLRRC